MDPTIASRISLMPKATPAMLETYITESLATNYLKEHAVRVWEALSIMQLDKLTRLSVEIVRHVAEASEEFIAISTEPDGPNPEVLITHATPGRCEGIVSPSTCQMAFWMAIQLPEDAGPTIYAMVGVVCKVARRRFVGYNQLTPAQVGAINYAVVTSDPDHFTFQD